MKSEILELSARPACKSVCPLEPYDDYIVVALKDEYYTEGGIALPDIVRSRLDPQLAAPERGWVEAVGPGSRLRHPDGSLSDERIPVAQKVGQEVIFNAFGRSDVKVGGVRYFIVREADILARVR